MGGVAILLGAVEDLEDEATAADAELQCSNWVFLVLVEIGTPFDVEADDEVAQAAAVDSLSLGEPVGDLGRVVGDQSVDAVGVEVDVVDIVCIVGEFVIYDANFHGHVECGLKTVESRLEIGRAHV